MKKKILILMIGLSFIGVNAFAAGDLIVKGVVGIGTTETPVSKLDIRSDIDALNVVIDQTSDQSVQAANYEVDISGSTDLAVTTAFKGLIKHTGTSKVPATRGGNLMFQFKSPTEGSSTFSFIYGMDLAIRDVSVNERDYSGNTIAMFRTGGSYDGLGTITVTDLIGAYIGNPNVQTYQNPNPLSATNLYGIKIEQQTEGSNNFGIVLDGEGAGADVVFGEHTNSVRPKIYSDGGQIYADDALGSHSLISPHDPVTGEWIFYSKNLRTGKVVKVNMEKLVKAVEKITGETFMIETVEEIK